MDKDIEVIIVDHDPMICQLQKKYIERISDFNVLAEVSYDLQEDSEVNIQKYIEKYIEKYIPVDLLIIDINWPGLDTKKIIKKIRKTNKILAVIVVSSIRNRDIVFDFFKLGIYDYIVKPYREERFMVTLENFKKAFRKVKNAEELTQNELDLIFRKDRFEDCDFFEDKYNNYIRNCPKGLNEDTLKSVKKALSRDQELNIQEISKKVGISRVTAQKYLKYLSEISKVDIIKNYGNVGRPKHFYKLK